jgi:putative ABC transport system ATP-binding protein
MAPAPPAPPVAPVAEAVEMTKVHGEGEAVVRAVDRVTLRLTPGSFTAVMGASGSGKSTLLHCLAGLDRPTGGAVRIDGTDLSQLSDKQLTRLRRDRVGFVFQTFNLVPTLTAEENIVLPLRLGRRGPDPRWFSTVTGALGLDGRLGHRPAELSGGQQQRVAVARALVTRPALVFADEPTGNLDRTSGAELLELLRASVDRYGQSTVLVTHDAAAAATADHVAFLADGRVVDELADPSVDGVLDRVRALESAGDRVEG